MGRKFIVPYGLYRCHGFISASLAGGDVKGTGFSQEDLSLLFDALINMFEFDRSAARMEMNARKLFAFKHESAFGNAHAQSLFDRVTVRRKEGVKVARAFSDYAVEIDRENLPQGVEILELL